MATLAPERLTGLCELMPPEKRTEREELLLKLLQEELSRAGGAMDLPAALAAVAANHRIAISQVKRGLNRGLAFGSLRLESIDGARKDTLHLALLEGVTK
jgi:hypothetical protein